MAHALGMTTTKKGGEGKGVPKDFYDPDAKVPRLPMPYRMIDRVLRDLIEEALEIARDDPPKEEPLLPLAPSFELEIPNIVAVQPMPDGLMVFVGTRAGKLHCVNSLRGEVVGEPVDLEDSIRCMAMAPNGRLLAVAVGGADDSEDAEPKPSTVKLMLVQSDSRPILKTVHSTPLSAEAVALHFSFDSLVFAALLKTGQLECFRSKIVLHHHHHQGEVHEHTKAQTPRHRILNSTLYSVALHSKYTRALTFENLCQRGRRAPARGTYALPIRHHRACASPAHPCVGGGGGGGRREPQHRGAPQPRAARARGGAARGQALRARQRGGTRYVCVCVCEYACVCVCARVCVCVCVYTWYTYVYILQIRTYVHTCI